MIRIVYRLLFILGAILIALGAMFKILHWPGAKILMISGYSVLGFVFSPLYFLQKFKKRSTIILKIIYFSGFIFIVSLSLSNILSDYIGLYLVINILSILILLPLLTYVVVKGKERCYKRIAILSLLYLYVAVNIFYVIMVVNYENDDAISKINIGAV